MLGDMTDLGIGDLVVHEDHGIARVVGLEPMPTIGDEAPGWENQDVDLRMAEDPK